MRSLVDIPRRWLARLLGRREKTPASPPDAPRGKDEHRTIPERIRRYGHKNITLHGEVVQSGPERRIADFLFKRGIRYVYEMDIPGATPDFFLPDHHIVIEHWGVRGTRYLENRKRKTRLYAARGYRLVETERRDVPRLELALEQRLRKVEPGIFDQRGR